VRPAAGEQANRRRAEGRRQLEEVGPEGYRRGMTDRRQNGDLGEEQQDRN
jgi:hypothetical protein